MSTISSQPIQTVTPNYSLYDSGAVALATLFGTPVAGASLMALNYRRLGRTGMAIVTLLVGLAVTSIVIALSWNLPRAVVSPIALVLLIAVQQIARVAQGEAVKEHAEKGGRLGSKGLAFGSGLVFFTVIVAMVFAVASISDRAANGSKLTIGGKDEIFYSGSATKQEAEALGSALKESGYLSDRGVSVFLAKGSEGTVISYVAKEGSWNDPSLVSSFEEITGQAAPSVGGFPVLLRIIDKEKQVKFQSIIGREALEGGDVVYYYGDVPQTQAHALGLTLKADDFFQGRGADVFLSRHSNNTTMSFVVRDGVWQDPAIVKQFEKIARDGANSVGGLPVTLRLMTSQLDVKKDEVIQ
ncbi:hypothetical protein P8935_09605 [Telmatobacter sp. DSM 110680]|uniref:Uncharacterized protein n=1 Tax=Telmatobacter sp. DSM 110680 TaxID=3036704 RepID=A0AAU7DRB6_9BACT